MNKTVTEPQRRSENALAASLLTGAAAAAGAAAGLIFGEGTTATYASMAGAGTAAAIAGHLSSRLLVVQPVRIREHVANRRAMTARSELRQQADDRAAIRQLGRELDQVDDEPDALAIVHRTLQRHLPERPIEVHLVDRVEPRLVLALHVAHPERRIDHDVSPWEPLACRTDQTLVYESTDQAGACRHLASRVDNPMSAIAVPLGALGRILGVLYAFGPEGEAPGDADIAFIEDIAQVVGTRLAVIRTVEPAGEDDPFDAVTGLPNRATMQVRVVSLLHERVPFSIAVVEIDAFAEISADRGSQAADAALALLGRVARVVIRPDDLVGRVGDDELLFVFPNTRPDSTTRVMERLREELALRRGPDDGPSFTMSIGVVGSEDGATIGTLLKRASEARQRSILAGGGRIIVADSTTAA